MGTDGSKPIRHLKAAPGSIADVTDNKIGLENIGNTCYVNSVLQALYWCIPFRTEILRYCEQGGLSQESLLECIGELFYQLQHTKKRSIRNGPKKLIQKMRAQSHVFASFQQQDTHEFFVYLLNDISDTIRTVVRSENNDETGSAGTVSDNGKVGPLPGVPDATVTFIKKENSCCSTTGSSSNNGSTATPEKKKPGKKASEPPTLVQEFFEGTFAAEMRCLSCESVTSREEEFLGLSVDIDQNVSLLAVLRNFSKGETMDRDNKFHCDSCRSLQEARRSLKMKRAPPILAIHLKRFKYIEEYGRHCKLSYRVPFPFSIRLPVEGSQADDEYHLFAVVIHLGVGPNMGHYVCMAKAGSQWTLFDDDVVTPITEREVAQSYGSETHTDASTSTGYLLFYSSLPFVYASSRPAKASTTVPEN
eukprot:TRINITY_DN5173_c0_g1_i1.p1 TRINITY_DN5173_c0_g1~~TRINITY_DN5173_c0_g1_i1.p1  ORF type:complete len:419 (+),score=45.21 TRINITY_DN5173_c0_g1_i1:109-1365(+)